jgi:hypothetical protein
VLFLIVAPVAGLFLGGIYSPPAIRFTKCRGPWLGVLLSAGFGIMVFGPGFLLPSPLFAIAGVWAFLLFLLLLVRHLSPRAVKPRPSGRGY